MCARLVLWLVLFFTFVSPVYAETVVPVRAGIHQRYNRLVFDWTIPVKYTLTQQGNNVIIQFDKPAKANFTSALKINPPFIRNLQQSSSGPLRVTFMIPDNARIQAFWSGKKVAFDVLHLSSKTASFTQNKATVTQPSVESTGPQTIEKATKALQEKAGQNTKSATLQETQTVAVNTPSTAVQPPPQESLSKPVIGNRLSDLLEGRKNTAVTAKPDNTTRVIEDGVSRIRFETKTMSRMAAFVRAGQLWTVLDQTATDLRPKIEGDLADELKSATRISLQNGVAYVFDMPVGINVLGVQREGLGWTVTMNDTASTTTPPEAVMTLQRSEATDKKRFSLYAGENPTIITVKDNRLGDRIWVIPMRSPEARVTQPRQTPDFTVLPTALGVVIVPRTDTVDIGTVNDMVIVTKKDGEKILVSPEADREKGQRQQQKMGYFKLDPSMKLPENLEGQRQTIEKAIITEDKPEKKALLHLELAKAYLRFGLGPEASGALNMAVMNNPAIKADPTYMALQGIAKALIADTEAVTAALSYKDIRTDPMAHIWRGYSAAANNDYISARASFSEAGDVDVFLPDALKKRVILAKAETAWEAGDIASAQKELKKFKPEELTLPHEKAAYDFIQANLMIATKNADFGLPIFKRLSKGKDALYRAKADLAMTKHKVATKKMPLKKAIEALEGLRYSWRGDRLEIAILRQLGRYYADDKNYMEALNIWRKAAGLATDPNDTDAITQDMQKLFADLYVTGLSDTIQPLQALAVYERFKELMPAGDAGDEAMQRLAKRLIGVDLLDQADAVLSDMMMKRATGDKALALGAQLAQLRIINKNPAGAINALDESQQTGEIPQDLDKKRRLLRARALADNGQIDEAMALLVDDLSPEALSLNADINWRQSRWMQSVTALQRLVAQYRDKGQDGPKGPMPPLILKMAIALAMDNNNEGLALLSAEHQDLMKESDKAKAFALITQQSRGSSLADLDTLKGQVGEVELYESFLRDFN